MKDPSKEGESTDDALERWALGGEDREQIVVSSLVEEVHFVIVDGVRVDRKSVPQIVQLVFCRYRPGPNLSEEGVHQCIWKASALVYRTWGSQRLTVLV